MKPAKMTLSEIGKKQNLTDAQLIKLAKEQLGMSEEEATLMLAIERGEIDGDIVEDQL